MAAKRTFYKVVLRGTGLNETLLVASHEVIAYPASTYHKFVFPDGRVLWKNDFGVSEVIVLPVGMSDAEYDAESNIR